MQYLNTNSLLELGRNWVDLIDVIYKTVSIMASNDYVQPLKPYLRYKNFENRIIAMPAYIGGDIDISGIKWIASFPMNIEKGLDRANSITILNESTTGVPKGIINSTMISCIRTAAVTGALLKKYIGLNINRDREVIIGMTGIGPIGKIHMEMFFSLLNTQIKELKIFDLNKNIDTSLFEEWKHKITFCKNYEEAFEDTDIFLTATVAKEPYIQLAPKVGSLHLNVSLRDYCSGFVKYVSRMIVDDWDEVCREKTDIEMMHLNEGLQKNDTINLIDVLVDNNMDDLARDEVVMFNPMGMAVFDIAVGKYYCELAKSFDKYHLLD